MNIDTIDFSGFLPAIVRAAPAALLILVVALLLNALIGRALSLLARRTAITEQEIGPVQRTVRWVIGIAALVLILGAFGLNIGGLWGVFSTILAMVAIGFVAVWSVLSNTLCTLIIILFRPFAVGDEVEFPGDNVKGRVIDLNFIYTTLQTDDGCVLQVPNNLFFQKVLRRRPAAVPVSPAAHLRAKQPEPAPTPLAQPSS